MGQKPRHAKALTFEQGLNPRSNINYEFRIACFRIVNTAALFDCQDTTILRDTWEYIRQNTVKAGLSATPEEYLFFWQEPELN